MTTDISVDYKLLGFLRTLFRNYMRRGIKRAIFYIIFTAHACMQCSTWTYPGVRAEGLHCGALFRYWYWEATTFLFGTQNCPIVIYTNYITQIVTSLYGI